MKSKFRALEGGARFLPRFMGHEILSFRYAENSEDFNNGCSSMENELLSWVNYSEFEEYE